MAGWRAEELEEDGHLLPMTPSLGTPRWWPLPTMVAAVEATAEQPSSSVVRQ